MKTLGTKDRTSPAPTLGSLSAEWLQRGWHFFCSVRLALVLILILTLLVLEGTLIMQVPQDVKAVPADYRWWLENPAREKFGSLVPLMARLQLYDVFHSLWFYLGGFLLVVNIVICTLNRWGNVWNSIRSLRVRLSDRLYEAGANRVSFSGLTGSSQEVAGRVRSMLSRRRYQVLEEGSPGALYLAGDKNRHLRLGTFLVHFSIILFILGYMAGSFFGFRLNAFMVPEGSVREVGYGTNLSVELLSFVDEYWPEGPPRDFRSEVVLYENGREVLRGTVRVNHYLRYKGVTFYQAFFGQALAMEVKDREGDIVFNDALALGWRSGKKPFERPLGFFTLPGSGYTVYVLTPAQGRFSDPLIKAGQVRVEVYAPGSQAPLAMRNLNTGVATELAGYTFTFLREKQFSGLQVTRDPGNALIWISSGLFILGISLVFYFPHRQVWVRLRRQGEGTELVLRSVASRSYVVTSELERLAEAAEDELGVTRDKVE